MRLKFKLLLTITAIVIITTQSRIFADLTYYTFQGSVTNILATPGNLPGVTVGDSVTYVLSVDQSLPGYNQVHDGTTFYAEPVLDKSTTFAFGQEERTVTQHYFYTAYEAGDLYADSGVWHTGIAGWVSEFHNGSNVFTDYVNDPPHSDSWYASIIGGSSNSSVMISTLMGTTPEGNWVENWSIGDPFTGINFVTTHTITLGVERISSSLTLTAIGSDYTLPVPEPSLELLLGISLVGLVGVGAVRKIKRKRDVKS